MFISTNKSRDMLHSETSRGPNSILHRKEIVGVGSEADLGFKLSRFNPQDF